MQKDSPSLTVPYICSILIHGIFFGWFIFHPTAKNELPFDRDQVINVSMVTMQEAASPAPKVAEEPAAKMEQAPKPEPPPQETVEQAPEEPPAEDAVSIPEPSEPEVKEAVPIEPAKPKVKTSLKKKTFKPKKVKKPVQKVKKPTKPPKSDPKMEALKKLKARVQADEASGRYKVSADAQVQGGSGFGGSGGAEAMRQREMVDVYRIEIARLVEKNWAYSKQMVGDNDQLLVAIMFRVMPDGQIRDITFTQRSGNQYFDDTAYKAVVKTNPAPRFPRELIEAAIIIGVRFTPEGLR